MANFTPDVLRHSSLWTLQEDECRQITGFPDNRPLNWMEGYEVLHFINRYMDYRGWYASVTFQKIESAIKTRLPFGLKTHNDIKHWLDENVKR